MARTLRPLCLSHLGFPRTEAYIKYSTADQHRALAVLDLQITFKSEPRFAKRAHPSGTFNPIAENTAPISSKSVSIGRSRRTPRTPIALRH